MNTKLLMSASAVVLGMTGVILSFFPQEITVSLGMGETAAIVLQVLGALYFGFAMINWMAKANMIGGIYSRPVAVGNLAHFMMGSLALIKVAVTSAGPGYLWVAAVTYSIFAVLFGYVFFATPALNNK